MMTPTTKRVIHVSKNKDIQSYKNYTFNCYYSLNHMNSYDN